VHGRPDLRIADGGALHGDDIYNSLKRQTLEQTGSVGSELRWQISVQNDATTADAIRLRGARSAHGFHVIYLDANGTNVTDEVVSGSFRTPRLTRHQIYRLTVVVEVTEGATIRQALKGEVHASSMLTPAQTDVVAFVANRG